MKTLNSLKFGFLSITFLLFTSTSLQAQNKRTFEDNVEITIDKSTTDKDFEGITSMLQEYGIKAEFKSIKRNTSKEITSLSITLSSKSGQQTSSSISSNRPINAISFGSKNGGLYIGKSRENGNMFALFNNNNFNVPFDMDSIFGGNGMSFKMKDFFSGNSDLFLFDSDTVDIDDLKKRFKQKFNFSPNSLNSFSFSENNNNNTSPRYRFVDSPEKETLIVIDGEISNFDTLDVLAKANKLTDVDVLKAETAMSIYGDKAKDGAIIAITKK